MTFEFKRTGTVYLNGKKLEKQVIENKELLADKEILSSFYNEKINYSEFKNYVGSFEFILSIKSYVKKQLNNSNFDLNEFIHKITEIEENFIRYLCNILISDYREKHPLQFERYSIRNEFEIKNHFSLVSRQLIKRIFEQLNKDTYLKKDLESLLLTLTKENKKKISILNVNFYSVRFIKDIYLKNTSGRDRLEFLLTSDINNNSEEQYLLYFESIEQLSGKRDLPLTFCNKLVKKFFQFNNIKKTLVLFQNLEDKYFQAHGVGFNDKINFNMKFDKERFIKNYLSLGEFYKYIHIKDSYLNSNTFYKDFDLFKLNRIVNVFGDKLKYLGKEHLDFLNSLDYSFLKVDKIHKYKNTDLTIEDLLKDFDDLFNKHGIQILGEKKYLLLRKQREEKLIVNYVDVIVKEVLVKLIENKVVDKEFKEKDLF